VDKVLCKVADPKLIVMVVLEVADIGVVLVEDTVNLTLWAAAAAVHRTMIRYS
jgi:hypothetical protein